ncbi:MAG TPA: diaminopropionate ammonia-lyase [Kiritimatiellia bacterium]|nr:diaminopropionate ammonia-lyase [Kiritimatiellia bacterium]OQC60459.1 MAG: Diaminopropionate ammonia-lyase [Verrucomicrobia bacterium ADurb.Bin018]MBP9572334.1 diaminopropionate ammonia-lyase [Kiritimatiellia bacterium]HOE01068.1 diaminopropionate ammonia-lyase [Kiritimatiellia bacterium]HOE36100.1 diaminopropionate ammonia-lyase [Kiritimatiellia bacterium]
MADLASKPLLDWVENSRAGVSSPCTALTRLLPPGITGIARQLHRQLDGYRMSPLKSLSGLAQLIGVGGVWVKDESQRLSLDSFKVLGGSFAIYQFLRKRLGIRDRELTVTELKSEKTRAQLGDLCFATATDGNHGRGVAWAAKQLGFRCVIYVHERTSRARIKAIEAFGAQVKVVAGTYDDAVRMVMRDAATNGWQIISDTSWPGYEDIPCWVMQGYTTMMTEIQEQLAGQGIARPTHVFVQAGVGALAAAVAGYYRGLFGDSRPVMTVVEPDRAACLYESARQGTGQARSVGGDLDTIMAGLACGDPSPIAWEILDHCADFFLSCPDFVAAKGMRVYAVPVSGDPFIVSGESGAVTLAAMMYIVEHESLQDLKRRMKLGPDSQILLINTEGNTDPGHFRRVVWEGSDPVPQEYRFPLV